MNCCARSRSLIALVSAFYLVTYYSMPPLLGWPTAADLPKRFNLVAIFVNEPDKSSGAPGEIFLWATDLAKGSWRFLSKLAYTPPSSIEGAVGPHRVWCHGEADLATVKRIGKAHGGTVNDVVLAAVTAGYRDLLVHRGDDPATTRVRTLVPVSVRRDDGDGIPDNRVSALLLELPVGITDPAERLAAVMESMAELKTSHMADAGEVVVDISNLAPPGVVGAVSRLGLRAQHLATQRSVNTVTTNVPGPQFPLYCLGREMLQYLPFVPISYGLRVGTAILSYNGELSFGVTGDWDSATDIGVLARGVVSGVDELAELT